MEWKVSDRWSGVSRRAGGVQQWVGVVVRLLNRSTEFIVGAVARLLGSAMALSGCAQGSARAPRSLCAVSVCVGVGRGRVGDTMRYQRGYGKGPLVSGDDAAAGSREKDLTVAWKCFM